MEAARLYDYALILQAKVDDNDNVTEPARLIARGEVLATSAALAATKVARLIPTEFDEQLERVDVAIRPF